MDTGKATFPVKHFSVLILLEEGATLGDEPDAGQPDAAEPAPCAGETYDVNGNIFDGCEVTDLAPGNHTQGAASSRGSKTCNDTDTDLFNGFMPSDARVHNPAISAFNAAVLEFVGGLG